MRVMMSAAGSTVAPGIIRHLQSLGHTVIGHDSSPHGAGTEIADEFYLSPPADDAEAYLAFLAARRCDLYLPFLDEELRAFNRISWLRQTWSPWETLAIFTSKKKQQKAFEDAGFPVAPQADEGEVIAKPDYGRGGKGTFRTGDELIIDGLISAGYLVQRFIEGDEYTVDVLTDLEGGFLFAMPRLRIQTSGVSVIGRIVLDQEIITLAMKIVERFRFAGPINVQMIRERSSGKLFIIELNPRLSGSCMFTVMAGFDILDATIRLFSGKPFIPPEKIEEITVRRYYVEEQA